MKYWYYKFILLLCVILLLLNVSGSVQASPSTSASERYERGVVLTAETVDRTAEQGWYFKKGQKVTVRMTSGPDKGNVVHVFNTTTGQPQFDVVVKPGDRVVLVENHDFGARQYQIGDFDRLPYVLGMMALFGVSLLLLARLIGLRSILVIGFSLLLLWKWFIVQAILPEVNIYWLTLALCSVISLITLLFVSGFSAKTWAAFVGTVGGVGFAALLSWWSLKVMHLSGLDSEEAIMLKLQLLPHIDIQGVLFAGMVIGALGAVIDVAVSIASAQYELHQSHPEADWRSLYKSGMNVGKDIMGAMSNTLILAYVGSSLPLLLLIAAQKQIHIEKVLNMNMIVSEFIGALTGSIGLIWAIPLTALVTALLLKRGNSSGDITKLQ